MSSSACPDLDGIRRESLSELHVIFHVAGQARGLVIMTARVGLGHPCHRLQL